MNEVGQILVGSYSIGYWSRYKYFRVKSHTKSGAPRVVELKKNLISNTSTPVDSTVIHELSNEMVEIGPVLTARKDKSGEYGVQIEESFGKTRAVLSPYVHGTQYREDSYW